MLAGGVGCRMYVVYHSLTHESLVGGDLDSALVYLQFEWVCASSYKWK